MKIRVITDWFSNETVVLSSLVQQKYIKIFYLASIFLL